MLMLLICFRRVKLNHRCAEHFVIDNRNVVPVCGKAPRRVVCCTFADVCGRSEVIKLFNFLWLRLNNCHSRLALLNRIDKLFQNKSTTVQFLKPRDGTRHHKSDTFVFYRLLYKLLDLNGTGELALSNGELPLGSGLSLNCSMYGHLVQQPNLSETFGNRLDGVVEKHHNVGSVMTDRSQVVSNSFAVGFSNRGL
ncbi:D-amino acid dehydrogenase [Trichinella spiralis]|uniref:D-amino acid dehydrogenase n=1 Tax=Trichinella spiralis TaxID=6334 RepID=A0ABR3K8C4_TRISP